MQGLKNSRNRDRAERPCRTPSKRRQFVAGTQLGVGRRQARSAPRKKRASRSIPEAHVYLPSFTELVVTISP